MAKKDSKILLIPNRWPFNELLVAGKLSAKTRNYRPSQKGLPESCDVLLYTSSNVSSDVARFHGLPARDHKEQRQVIVGMGHLDGVRPIGFDSKEYRKLTAEFRNHVRRKPYEMDQTTPAHYAWPITNLVRFVEPIRYKFNAANNPFGLPILVDRAIIEDAETVNAGSSEFGTAGQGSFRSMLAAQNGWRPFPPLM